MHLLFQKKNYEEKHVYYEICLDPTRIKSLNEKDKIKICVIENRK